jgi:hypothetical protein
VKRTFRILASLALAILFAVEFSNCSRENASATATPAAPVNEIDLKINDYEKVANQYAKVSKRLKGGDMSVTVPCIELGKQTREAAAKLQAESPKMTPPQTQRVAAISARMAPYLQ